MSWALLLCLLTDLLARRSALFALFLLLPVIAPSLPSEARSFSARAEFETTASSSSESAAVLASSWAPRRKCIAASLSFVWGHVSALATTLTVFASFQTALLYICDRGSATVNPPLSRTSYGYTEGHPRGGRDRFRWQRTAANISVRLPSPRNA